MLFGPFAHLFQTLGTQADCTDGSVSGSNNYVRVGDWLDSIRWPPQLVLNGSKDIFHHFGKDLVCIYCLVTAAYHRIYAAI